jgi:oxygen-independent coproporphyrinogen-3 oxidase
LDHFLIALHKEIKVRNREGQDGRVETIYFGGGTPSVLPPAKIAEILRYLHDQFNIDPHAEITLEANPEDLDKDFATGLLEAGVNRLSIGCQSFRNEDLRLMNRRHDARKAAESVLTAAGAGFKNISIDLIYGIPDMTTEMWGKNLMVALDLPIQHISAYLLTFEERTVFGKWLEKEKIRVPPEEKILKQYRVLIEMTRKKRFIHYEISNFGKEGFFSKHNLLYWSRKRYLGFGPSAHSYNLQKRRWNVSDVKEYIRCIEEEHSCFEEEILTTKEQYNDYVLTALRTQWGVRKSFLRKEFSPEVNLFFRDAIASWTKTGHVTEEADTFRLTDKGILVSDTIISDCMIVEDLL